MFAEATVREEDVRQLIRQPESQTLEFKSYTPDVATLSRLLSAFANTNGGTLVVGVKEGGAVVGVNVRRLMSAVEQAKTKLNPSQHIRLDTPTVDGKQIGVLRIGRSAEAPVFADAGVFVREGDVDRPMSADDLTRRLQQAPEPHDEVALATAIANQTTLIETLRIELHEANGWKSKMKDYVIGGIVGAILGALASLVIK
jgi:predicted HTH transcriptional regulator